MALAGREGLAHGRAAELAGRLLGRVFTERCELLEAAELRLEGLFLNADKAFDVTRLRQACDRCGIEANVPRNRRSADWPTDDDTPLDPER